MVVILTFLPAAALAAADTAVPPAGTPAARPRHLLVQVRDTPPRGPGGIHHGADGSYTVSTGGGETDDRAAQAPDNGTTLSTSNAVRRVHVVEGERVRVDLPAVQSLQFHQPVPANGGNAGSAGASTAPGGRPAAAISGAASGAASGNAPGTASTGNSPPAAASSAATTGTGAGPSVSGVVYFEAVSAFAARFAVAGNTVRIELVPLRLGTVAAPFAAAAAGTDAPVIVTGRLGEWIALGDTDLQGPRKSLNATAEPPSPASVWVRVYPDVAGPAQ